MSNMLRPTTRFGIAERLFFTLIDRDDDTVAIDHKDGVGDEIEQRFVPFLGRDKLLRPLGDGLFQLGRVLLQLLLQPVTLSHVSNKRPGVNEAAAFLFKQRRRVNLNVDSAPVLCKKDGLDRIAPMDINRSRYTRTSAAWLWGRFPRDASPTSHPGCTPVFRARFD